MASISSRVQPGRPTVAEKYVRKTDPAEVLISDWREISATQHVVTARWPRAHSFYTPQPDSHSALLFTESLRQALALLTHTAFGIPLDHPLGWDYLRCAIAPEGLLTAPGPDGVEMHVTHTSVNRRRLGTARMTALVETERNGRSVGSAEVRYTTYPGAIYNRLRGHHADTARAFARALPPGPPAPPALVGREHERDVVLSSTGTDGFWRLRADTTHSVLFDHPHDHIPGMVLLEAFGQAAQAASAPYRVRPVSFDATFNRYVELDRPCLISTEALTLTNIRLVATQDSAVAATAVVTSAPIV
ncbi:hypothetical protein F0344_34840 (plasmid) [Streptomyces finlayi]|uniref:A-factor biosynthesis hotdog domain-containing protein n=1 Tax=Streptomyces finlayi TaxID=67296 RepID=A0A7G7BWC0_9ACTN|nr:ScbA/BarX family gamma-butyrolactone biosynthesis protein [Streptomyces finlayi]QNE79635.1 hypothetical protein F0344_34840 [Streptomyces finlayi]